MSKTNHTPSNPETHPSLNSEKHLQKKFTEFRNLLSNSTRNKNNTHHYFTDSDCPTTETNNLESALKFIIESYKKGKRNLRESINSDWIPFLNFYILTQNFASQTQEVLQQDQAKNIINFDTLLRTYKTVGENSEILSEITAISIPNEFAHTTYFNDPLKEFIKTPNHLLPKLRHLDLSEINLLKEDIKNLLESGHLTNIESLHLKTNDTEAIELLKDYQTSPMPILSHLDLSESTCLPFKKIIEIISSENFCHLKSLDLRGIYISDENAKALINSSYINQTLQLTISTTNYKYN